MAVPVRPRLRVLGLRPCTVGVFLLQLASMGELARSDAPTANVIGINTCKLVK